MMGCLLPQENLFAGAEASYEDNAALEFDFLRDYMLNDTSSEPFSPLPLKPFARTVPEVPENELVPTPLSPMKEAEETGLRRSARKTVKNMPRSRRSVHAKTAGKRQKTKTQAEDAKWKPARGRGRQKQLEKMTEEEKRAEAAWRLEKNRLAARDCRRAKKERLEHQEEQLELLGEENKRLTAQNSELAEANSMLRMEKQALIDEKQLLMARLRVCLH